MKFNLSLQNQIFISLILGVVAGLLFKDIAGITEPIGEIFIHLLRMIIVPLVLASIVVGMVSLGDVSKIGGLGLRTFIYFVFTTLAAIAIGLILAHIIKPGLAADISIETSADMLSREIPSIKSLLINIVPQNVISALAEEKMLSIIFFAVLLGGVLTSVPKKAKILIDIFDSVNDVMMKMTDVIMKLAPLGVFALMATMIAQTGVAAMKPLVMYIVCVLLGLFLHSIITLPLLLSVLAKFSPIKHLQNMIPALATAFSTASSAVSLPITMECLIDKSKVSEKVTSFTIPLGTTINMDGTALYQAVAALFIAQIYGIDLSLYQQIIIALTATFASIGAAAVPSAGLITMVMILNSVGLPIEGIGLIMGVDRLLDMFRSTVNLWGNACGAVIIDKFED